MVYVMLFCICILTSLSFNSKCVLFVVEFFYPYTHNMNNL